MKSTLKFGLVTGTVSILFLFGSFTLCTWLNEKYGWGLQAATIRGIGGLLSIPIQAIGVYMAMQNVKQATGGLTYARAVKTGLVVAATVAVMVAIFSLIYCTLLNPGYADFMVRDAEKAMIAAGKSRPQVNTDLAGVRQQFTTGAQVTAALVGQFVTGLIMALIIGIFVKTKK